MVAFIKHNWFPLALAALFLLAAPGLVLTVYTMLGGDEDLNGWLQEHWNLSYHLALPTLPATLLLLAPLFLLLLYFLKLKRKPLEVPSTFLWKKSIEDLHVNSLFQWLKQNILLVLQILIILFLIYSVLGIRFHGGSTQARHYILLIDNSASMAATDVSPSRLEVAKEQALKEIDAAGDDDFGMVIVFNSKASTLQGYTKNKAKLREAVRGIEQTQRPTHIDEALTLAESLANPVRSTEDVATQPDNVPDGAERTFVQPKGIAAAVHLFTDGRFSPLAEATLAALSNRQTGSTKVLGNLNLSYHPIGQAGAKLVNNVGIVTFNAVRANSPKNKDANPDLQSLQVFLRVRNFRPEKTSVKLRLDVMANGRLVHPEQVTLNLPGRVVKHLDRDGETAETDEPGEASASFVLPAMDLRDNIVLRAYLDGHQDDFALDDQAWLVVGGVRKAKVLHVGPANAILSAFFEPEAAKKIVSYEHLGADSKDEYRKLARAGEVDLVIFDRCAPDQEIDMPLANTFFIGNVPPPWRNSGKTLKNPILVAGKKDHPLFRFLTTLWDLGVSETLAFDPVENLNPEVKALVELPEGDKKRRHLPPLTPLLEAGKTPVLFTVSRGAYTDLVLTFPLIDKQGDLVTNWPLQPSFPLFLRNVLFQLGNVDDSVRSVTVQPGEPMVLRPEAGVDSLDITSPRGKKARLERGIRPDMTYADTEQVGVYGVARPDGGQRSFAVNLLDSAESNIEPRLEIQLGGDKFVAGQQRVQPRELWKWILVLALALLLVEWYIYNRRVAL